MQETTARRMTGCSIYRLKEVSDASVQLLFMIIIIVIVNNCITGLI